MIRSVVLAVLFAVGLTGLSATAKPFPDHEVDIDYPVVSKAVPTYTFPIYGHSTVVNDTVTVLLKDQNGGLVDWAICATDNNGKYSEPWTVTKNGLYTASVYQYVNGELVASAAKPFTVTVAGGD